VSQIAVTSIMAGAALVALGVLVPAVRRARAAGDVDASTGLTLGMAWLVSLPSTLVAISGGAPLRQDAFGDFVAIFPGWYQHALDVTVLLVAALAGVLLFKRLTSQRVPVHTAGLFAILLWAVAQLASGLHGGPLLSPYSGVLLVCLMAATVLPRGRGACLGAGIFGVTLAVVSGVLAVFRYDVAFVPCSRKCTVLGSLLAGVFPNANLLGLALAAAIPFAYLGFRGRARIWFALYLAGMTVATGSRTAIAAAVATVVFLLIVRPRVDADRPTPGRTAIAGLALAGAVFGSAYVIQHEWSSSALTARPALWRVASTYVHDSPWFGYGPEKWASLTQASRIPPDAAYSAHNEWLDVLFVAGWVGAALFVSMVMAAVVTSGRARPGVLITLATIVVVGTTERPWSVGALDWLSFSLVALILTGATGDGETFDSMAKHSAVRSRRTVYAYSQNPFGLRTARPRSPVR
jgi:O-antigen ligase